jgi:hypothetical protein
VWDEFLPSTVFDHVTSHSSCGFSHEKENGQTCYDAELMVKHSKGVFGDASGSLVEMEEQISTESLPAAVRQGLQGKAGRGKLIQVETLTKQEQLVAYEGQSFDQWKEVRGSKSTWKEKL